MMSSNSCVYMCVCVCEVLQVLNLKSFQTLIDLSYHADTHTYNTYTHLTHSNLFYSLSMLWINHVYFVLCVP